MNRRTFLGLPLVAVAAQVMPRPVEAAMEPDIGLLAWTICVDDATGVVYMRRGHAWHRTPRTTERF